ncbi:MAG: PorT family protein [Saprospiraceae bacterium]|nr:PorT family protein [Saprospiraceae bacterium]
MKRSFLPFFLLLCTTLFFQVTVAQTVKVGVKAGLLLSNLDITPRATDDPELKQLSTFHITIPVEIGLKGIFAIQPEIMYGLNGTRFDQTTNALEGGTVQVYRHTEGWVRVSTIEVPALAKVKFGSRHWKFHLLAGPSMGFGLSGKSHREFVAKITQPDGTVSAFFTEENNLDVAFKKDGYPAQEVNPIQWVFRRNSVNLHLGAGLNLSLGKVILFVDGRYMLGLTDLIPDAAGAVQPTTAKSRRVGVSAAVLFPLKG